jgi:hypothetical protein
MKKMDYRFDKRVIMRNLRNGVIPRSEYDKYVAGLKDCANEADAFEASLKPVEKKIPTSVLDEDDEL